MIKQKRVLQIILYFYFTLSQIYFSGEGNKKQKQEKYLHGMQIYRAHNKNEVIL